MVIKGNSGGSLIGEVRSAEFLSLSEDFRTKEYLKTLPAPLNNFSDN